MWDSVLGVRTCVFLSASNIVAGLGATTLDKSPSGLSQIALLRIRHRSQLTVSTKTCWPTHTTTTRPYEIVMEIRATVPVVVSTFLGMPFAALDRQYMMSMVAMRCDCRVCACAASPCSIRRSAVCIDPVRDRRIRVQYTECSLSMPRCRTCSV